ncbi:MAG: signal recognition particle-docking protein FtsY [Clostridia bacterium]|nr:signal recognition particle-docking protein FtsY [Clostridia bacterium]
MIFSKIKEAFSGKIASIFKSNSQDIDEAIDQIEETLILADVGITTSTEVCDNLRKKLKKEDNITEEIVNNLLKQELISILNKQEYLDDEDVDKKVILVVGVNGVGKTTSIAKLSNIYKNMGKKVMLVAGDTFRAGAREQLQIWSEVAGVECICGADNADPASVIFDGSKQFIEKDYDVLICDTAGRLHNKKNLMDEIEKIKRTIDKNIETCSKEVLMVIDATTGQNAVEQAKAFYDKTSVDGIILTKLDSTAKGGVVFSIINELSIPIKYIGIGEKIEDIRKFEPKEFVEGII